jgi:sec-independent protein translocase protein TatB
MVLIGAAALIFFGPDQLPKVARRAGQVVRDVQNTSQSFIREMEKAADEAEFRERAETIVTPPTKSESEPGPAESAHEKEPVERP